MDEVVNESLSKWTESWLPKAKKRRTTEYLLDLMKKKQSGYRAMQHAISVNKISGRMSIARKHKLEKKKSFKLMFNVDDVNVYALKDINRSIQLKVYYVNFVEKFSKKYFTFYDWSREVLHCGGTLNAIIGDGVGVDYNVKINPLRAKFVDNRVIFCDKARAEVVNRGHFASGFVPYNIKYDSRTCPSTRFFCSARPIVMKYSTVPDSEEKLNNSMFGYKLRKEVSTEEDFEFESEFVEGLKKKIRSVSEASERDEENKRCCQHDLHSSFLDDKMIHHSFCSEFNIDEDDIHIESMRLWFISNLTNFEEECAWLDAKLRRSLCDIYHFESCSWCEKSYEVLNYLLLRSSCRKDKDCRVPLNIVNMMSKFCSYSCFNSVVSSDCAYNIDQDLRLVNLYRSICFVCQKSTYNFCDPGNTWRAFHFRLGFGVSDFDFVPICSDDCSFYLENKISEFKSYKVSSTVQAIFGFYTCFCCSRILLASDTVVHFRNFPRLPWAYCCYNPSCISKTLSFSCPGDPLRDHYFLAPSVPFPFDRVDGLEPHQDVVEATLRAFNVKHMSSCSGGRFILTILE